MPLKRRHRQGQPAQHKRHAAIRRERPKQLHTGQVPQLDIEAEQDQPEHKAGRGQATAPVETAFSGHPSRQQQSQCVKLLQLQSRLQRALDSFFQH